MQHNCVFLVVFGKLFHMLLLLSPLRVHCRDFQFVTARFILQFKSRKQEKEEHKNIPLHHLDSCSLHKRTRRGKLMFATCSARHKVPPQFPPLLNVGNPKLIKSIYHNYGEPQHFLVLVVFHVRSFRR